MIQLFLSRPLLISGAGNSDDPKYQHIISLFSELEKRLWDVMTSNGRSELRLWLCDAIPRISFLSQRQTHDFFMSLLKSNKVLAAHILQMVFEKKPDMLGSLLAKRSHLLVRFFRGHPERILRWFSSFSFGGEAGYGKGAKALSQFAFVNRGICWKELQWKGKHGQSPAVVATKPHYFLDLDIQQTIENFLENVPEFWSSDQFSESLGDGEILSTDTKYFVDLFVRLMYKEGQEDVWDVISEFLLEESFRNLSQRLLIILEEKDLIAAIEMIKKKFNKHKQFEFSNCFGWLEMLLSQWPDFIPMDDLLFINALFTKRRQILRLLHSGETEKENVKIKDLLSQIYVATVEVESVLPVCGEFLKSKTAEILKWLGLLSLISLYKMSEECRKPKLWESFFDSNGIRFRKSEKYNLLYLDESSKESEWDSDDRNSKRKKRKKQKQKKKRKLDIDQNRFDDDLLDTNTIDDRLHLESKMGSYLLSTDGYSSSWCTADLPEYLSEHCLATWTRQFVTHLNGST